MNELIKVNYDSDRPTVSARGLHEFLDVKTPYDKWFPRMCEYGFSEGIDYSTFLSDRVDGLPGKPRQDAQLTIEMAKEICMLQRNEKGKQARQYFIQLEKDWNSPARVMARALQIADRQLKSLQTQVEIMEPKAQYFDELVARKLLTNFRDTAHQIGMGQKEFIGELFDRGYIYRDANGKIKPYQRYLENGLFELKDYSARYSDNAGKQTLITPKGKQTFLMLFGRSDKGGDHNAKGETGIPG